MLEKNFIPKLPFPNFKWKWACLQCTEGINDPVVLLGVLFRMRKLEPLHVTYSSKEFADELIELSNDIKDTNIGVDLARRTGSRNIMRNSGQYWKAVGLVDPTAKKGIIKLSDFGRKVADRDISQTEFAAITIQTFTLPNIQIQSKEECSEWLKHGIILHPLRLILQIELYLWKDKCGYLTTEELVKIIIPLSAHTRDINDFVNFIKWYRNGEISIDLWPNCCVEANDFRIAREFLLFLSNYGYLNCIKQDKSTRSDEHYYINDLLIDEIGEIINTQRNDASLETALSILRHSEVTDEIERKRVKSCNVSRPNQANFRKAVLASCKRCVITNISMPEILEAAHIKPFKYKGEDTAANGFAMRTDIHTLFDAGHLRISVNGDVELSNRARLDYGMTIPPRIVIPGFINLDFIKWRWDNYNGV